MQPTIIGAIVTLAGLIVSTRSLTSVLSFVLLCSLLGGASVASIGSHGGTGASSGGSSIPPADFALLFLGLRMLISRVGRFPQLIMACRQNLFFVVYCLYSAVTAILLPKLFAHRIDVVPMRSLGSNLSVLYAVVPLHTSLQNVTTALYLLGTLFAALATAVIIRLERTQAAIVRVIVAVTWLHISFGILGAILGAGGHADWLDFLRNGSYAQLDQSTEGVQRIAGIFPEASAYAAYGFFFFAFNAELWLRNIRSTITGMSAICMLLMLLCTTSSTAYVSIAAYALALLLRVALTPMHLSPAKMISLMAMVFAALVAVLGIAAIFYSFGNEMLRILNHATFAKAQTLSGRQRLFWAEQGFHAFTASYGLGIGVGSFRSSSLLSAVLGSTGVIGAALLLAAFLGILRIFRPSSHDLRGMEIDRVSNAAAWAAVMGMIPAFITAPGADPGIIFGIFAGIAVAGRLPRPSKLRLARLQLTAGPGGAVAQGGLR